MQVLTRYVHVLFWLFITSAGQIYLSGSVEARVWPKLCSSENSVLDALGRRLDRAETSRGWRAIYQEGATLRSRLVQMDPQQKISPDEKRALSCVISLMLESALYLSDEKIEGPLWAMRATGLLVTLSSLQLDALQSTEAKAWMKIVLTRAQRPIQPKKGKPSKLKLMQGWQRVEIPAQTKPFTLMMTLKASAWVDQCGLVGGCADTLSWTVYTQLDQATELYLPKAHYQATWSGPCVSASSEVDLTKSRLDKSRSASVALPVPPLRCRSLLTLIDGQSGDELTLSEQSDKLLLMIEGERLSLDQESIKISEGERVQVQLQGYQSAEGVAPAHGAPLTVKLKRCTVTLKPEITPRDATIEGPKRVFWGRPYTLKISRAGYTPLTRQLIAPQPAQCEGEEWSFQAELSREIRVVSTGADGLRLRLSQLKVSGLSHSADQPLYRPVGKYRVEASSQGLPPLLTTLSVPACEQSHCDDATLKLSFDPPVPPPVQTGDRLVWVGGSIAVAGLSVLALAYQSERRYDQDLSYVHPLNEIHQKTGQLYWTGWGILTTGVLTSLVGFAWPSLTSRPVASPPQIEGDRGKL